MAEEEAERGEASGGSSQGQSSSAAPGRPGGLKRRLSDVQNLYLFSTEGDSQFLLSKMIHSLGKYENTIPSAPTEGVGTEEGPDQGNGSAAPPPEQKGGANLGTFMGVYLPCIQNIFGVILFIRMGWVVGTAGVVCAFAIVFMCCSVTLLTSISMSAIATNGVVPAGGSYFMISRSLGPEFGGAVGILFYIGTTFGGAMYVVGAIEILITYMAPSISLFGDTNVPENMYNNYRVYGSILLACIGSIVFVGVKFVNKFASVALVCVLGSIFCIFLGIFLNSYGNNSLQMCVLGTRLLMEDGSGKPSEEGFCSKEPGSPLYETFCKDGECDDYFERHNTTIVQGIKGLASGVFYENLWPNFMELNQIIARSKDELDINPKMTAFTNGTHVPVNYNQVIIDITTSFTILVGIFFPSVTGIMAGSNRSGDLADAQKSIPIGTIMAILTTSTVYLASVVLFGATVDGLLMRDKFGLSVGGKLLIANVAWPNEWVILIGSFAAAIGAGMQSLTGAPRLLQAIAKDGIIPILEPLKVSSSRGEPTRALILTLALCEFGVLLGNVDVLAPLLSMFFLGNYGFVNLACAVQTLLKTPNWRPRFKFYHWSLSLLGVGLCLTVMFMASWFFALIAMGIAALIYKYIDYTGAKKEWGDGIRGVSLSAARFALLRLEEGPPHTKNWRPQILAFLKIGEDSADRKLLGLASQLKAGKGLTIAGTVVKGGVQRQQELHGEARTTIRRWMEGEKVKGFTDVLVCPDVPMGMSCMVQESGLGGLKPNTVLIGWPTSWRGVKGGGNTFLRAITQVAASEMALLIPKGIKMFPSAEDRVSGTIDVWWIVHRGGLLLLLPFLLTQHRTWKGCRIRIFTVAQKGDNTEQMKKDLQAFVYALRIDADVEVVEMPTGDVSIYVYERTLLMEQRDRMLKELNLSSRRKRSLVENLDDGGGSSSSGMKEPAVETISEEPAPEGGEAAEGEAKDDGEGNDGEEEAKKEETDSGAEMEIKAGILPSISPPKSLTPHDQNVKRMHTAVKLNEVIVKTSHAAKLVIVNLPGVPTSMDEGNNYMEFLEVLTEGLDRTLLVRGGGREVITIYS